MKSFQSKFSNKKVKSQEKESGKSTSSTAGGCCCGSKNPEGVDEIDMVEIEEE